MEYSEDDPSSPGGKARADFSWQRVRAGRVEPLLAGAVYNVTHALLASQGSADQSRVVPLCAWLEL